MTTTLTHRTDNEHQTIARAASDLGIHVEIPRNVRSVQQVYAEMLADGSEDAVQLIATLVSGRVYANVERTEYLDADGDPDDTSTIEVSVFLPNGNHDHLGEGKVAFCGDSVGRIALLRDVAAVTEAAATFVDAYVAASTAKIEVR